MQFTETPASPRIWQPVRALRGNLTLDRDVVAPVLALRPHGWINGERINDLSPLPPERHFREKMLQGARLFVDLLSKKRERFRLVTPEADLRIYGPGISRGFGKSQTPAPGEMATVVRGNEEVYPEEVTMYIIGDFVAEYGFLVPDTSEEEQKQIRIATVQEWEAAEQAAMKRMEQEQRRR